MILKYTYPANSLFLGLFIFNNTKCYQQSMQLVVEANGCISPQLSYKPMISLVNFIHRYYFLTRYLTMKYSKNKVYIRIGIETKCFRVYHVKVRLHAYQDTISDKILLLSVCIFRMIRKVVR